jgi:predicted dehydrogenase
MEKIGVGIIGAGWVAGEHAKAYSKNPITRIVAVSSGSIESAKTFAATHKIEKVYSSHTQLLEDEEVQVVSICSPNYLHYQHAIDAAKARKHILLEKPMCTTASEAYEIAKQVKSSGIKFMVGHVARFVPMFQTLRKIVDDGYLGNLYYAEGDYQHFIEPSLKLWSWCRFTKFGKGMFLAGGTHVVDLVSWFLGEPREVFGYSGNFVRKDIDNTGDTETPDRNEDAAVALVKYESGAFAKILTLIGAKRPYKFHFSLFGKEGFYDDGAMYSEKIPGLKKGDVYAYQLSLPVPSLEHWEVEYHPFTDEINHFVDCIINDEIPLSNEDDGVKVMRIVDGFYRSVKEHKWVSV